MKTKTKEIIRRLRSLADPKAVEGMARYGINSANTLGVSIPKLRKLAKETGKDHALALEVWATGIHEARMLAAMVDEPELVGEAQMDVWAEAFDSWDVCDQVCSNLFDKTPFAHKKAVEWSARDEEFVKRAGFTLMACLAVHDKNAGDEAFRRFLPLIEKESCDDRNYVRKAVNWALRQIGKRNLELNKKAIEAAENIARIDSKPARWVASDALRELRSVAVQERLRRKR
jgi:3-methyladenine DNA glycosylase AlkD